jgi:hypothetical protein
MKIGLQTRDKACGILFYFAFTDCSIHSDGFIQEYFTQLSKGESFEVSCSE